MQFFYKRAKKIIIILFILQIDVRMYTFIIIDSIEVYNYRNNNTLKIYRINHFILKVLKSKKSPKNIPKA